MLSRPSPKPLEPHESRCPTCSTDLVFRRRGRTETTTLIGFGLVLTGLAAAIVFPIIADQLVTHQTSRLPSMIVGAAFGIFTVLFGLYTALAGPWAWRCACGFAQRWQPRPKPPKVQTFVPPAKPIDLNAPPLAARVEPPPQLQAIQTAVGPNGEKIVFVALPQQAPRPAPAHCCPQCYAPLKYVRGSPSSGTVLVGIIGCLIALSMCATVYGAVLGIPLLIISCILGSIGEKYPACSRCAYGHYRR